jgi:hypothetical protein
MLHGVLSMGLFSNRFHKPCIYYNLIQSNDGAQTFSKSLSSARPWLQSRDIVCRHEEAQASVSTATLGKGSAFLLIQNVSGADRALVKSTPRSGKKGELICLYLRYLWP